LSYSSLADDDVDTSLSSGISLGMTIGGASFTGLSGGLTANDDDDDSDCGTKDEDDP
jgi:hypothetical protein